MSDAAFAPKLADHGLLAKLTPQICLLLCKRLNLRILVPEFKITRQVYKLSIRNPLILMSFFLGGEYNLLVFKLSMTLGANLSSFVSSISLAKAKPIFALKTCHGCIKFLGGIFQHCFPFLHFPQTIIFNL